MAITKNLTGNLTHESLITSGVTDPSPTQLTPWPGTFTRAEPDTGNNVATVSFKLRNALLDYTKEYPRGTMYNAHPFVGFDQRDTPPAAGFGEYLFQWKHYHPFFVGNDYINFLANNFKHSTSPYTVIPLVGNEIGALQPRVWNMFGIGSYIPANNGQPYGNDQMRAGKPFLVNNTTAAQQAILNGLTSEEYTSYNPFDVANASVRNQMWARQDWSQVIPILNDSDMAVGGFLKVGAQFRFPTFDKMRSKNFAGMYVSFEYGPIGVESVSVDYVAFVNTTEYPTSAVLNLTKGTIDGTVSPNERSAQNSFTGLAANNAANNTDFSPTNKGVTIITERGFEDQAEYEDFKEYTVDIPIPAGYTGINAQRARVKIAFYYAENMDYMVDNLVNVSSLVLGDRYVVVDLGNSTQADWLDITGKTVGADVNATDLELNGTYTIKSQGTTDFVALFGAADNDIGTAFVATADGDINSGSGIVSLGGTVVGAIFTAVATKAGTTATANALTGSFDFFSPHVEYIAPP